MEDYCHRCEAPWPIEHYMYVEETDGGTKFWLESTVDRCKPRFLGRSKLEAWEVLLGFVPTSDVGRLLNEYAAAFPDRVEADRQADRRETRKRLKNRRRTG